MQNHERGSVVTQRSEDCPDLSIVIPVYYDQGALKTLVESIKKKVLAQHPDLSCEIVFVDDGSGDGSLDELLEIRDENPALVKVIKLTRNFGQPYARLAGLFYARGKCVVSMSADGQNPPELINDLLHAHFEENYQIVICARSGRDETWFRIVTSWFFYMLMRKLSFSNMPKGGFDFVLLGRKALDIILRNQDAHPFFQGQILWTGFRSKTIEYHRLERKVGKSRWTLGKRITLLIDGVLGYSFAPIRIISLFGMATTVAGFMIAILILVRRLILGTSAAGWSTLIVTILIMGGIQTLMLGVIGEYLWRTLAQSRNRELYIVECIYDSTDPES